jgi:hypothetical protein
MDSLARSGGRSLRVALVVALASIVFANSRAFAQGGDLLDDGVPGTPLAVTGAAVAREHASLYGPGIWWPYETGKHGHDVAGDHALRAWLWEQRVACITHGHGGLGLGTLGYGGHGLDSGFYGFGLSFHLGYGYGGLGLGVGAFGGYPYYGGPGYPSDWNAQYVEPGQLLVVDRPVAMEAFDPAAPDFPSDYGRFTGAIPYPETLFAPYAKAAATSGSSSGPNPQPIAPPPADNRPTPGAR